MVMTMRRMMIVVVIMIMMTTMMMVVITMRTVFGSKTATTSLFILRTDLPTYY